MNFFNSGACAFAMVALCFLLQAPRCACAQSREDACGLVKRGGEVCGGCVTCATGEEWLPCVDPHHSKTINQEI